MTQEVISINTRRRKSIYIYDMYSKSLFSVINVLVRIEKKAEDVLQDVFVKIWKNIDSYNDSKDVSIPGY
jgi:RNA polymerase sigma-70 factor (ECF subfamily)